ncbi:hypothetical protein D3C74_324930 [compost metagenome]
MPFIPSGSRLIAFTRDCIVRLRNAAFVQEPIVSIVVLRGSTILRVEPVGLTSLIGAFWPLKLEEVVLANDLRPGFSDRENCRRIGA